jgi:hypothetical protein
MRTHSPFANCDISVIVAASNQCSFLTFQFGSLLQTLEDYLGIRPVSSVFVKIWRTKGVHKRVGRSDASKVLLDGYGI